MLSDDLEGALEKLPGVLGRYHLIQTDEALRLGFYQLPPHLQ